MKIKLIYYISDYNEKSNSDKLYVMKLSIIVNIDISVIKCKYIINKLINMI